MRDAVKQEALDGIDQFCFERFELIATHFSASSLLRPSAFLSMMIVGLSYWLT